MGNKKRIQNYILYMLERRDYSETELRNKLQNKEYYNEKYANEVIEHFKEINYISEERCVESLVRSEYNKLYGLSKIKQKAFQRGLNEKLVFEESLKYDFFQSCKDYLDKKYPNLSKKEILDYKYKQKITQKMLYRGFNIEQINFCLDEILTSFD